MKITFFIGSFRDFLYRKFLYLVLLTLANYLYCIEVLNNFFLFSLREVVLIILILLADFYRVELATLAKEGEYIDQALYQDYPVLRYRSLLGFCTFVLVFYSSTLRIDSTDSETSSVEWLFIILGTFSLGFIGLTLLYFSAIFNNSKVSGYFDIGKAIKHHGVRSFSTFSAVNHVCKVCVQGGMSLVVCDFVGPILADGDLGARGFLINFYSDHLRPYGYGIKGRTFSEVGEVNSILDRRPGLRPLLVGPDNWIKSPALDTIYDEWNVKRRDDSSVKVEHKLKLPFFRSKD